MKFMLLSKLKYSSTLQKHYNPLKDNGTKYDEIILGDKINQDMLHIRV